MSIPPEMEGGYPAPAPEQPRTNADCPLCGKSIYNSAASWKGHFLVTHEARPEQDEAVLLLREALEEAISLPLHGGFQMKQAEWRRVATAYDRVLATPPPVPAALPRHTCRQGIEPCVACEEADALATPPSRRYVVEPDGKEGGM